MNRLQSHENLTEQSEAVDDRDASQTGATPRDGFADFLSAMKSRLAQTPTTTTVRRTKSMDSAPQESAPGLPMNQRTDNSMNSLSNQFEQTEIDTVYNQIISEDLSEETMHPKGKDSLDPYDYDPAPPQ